MLYAGIADRGLCIAADVPMTDLSAGYVGASDGWQDLARHGRFTWTFDRAERGNVALSASLGEPAGVIAVGFAPDRGERAPAGAVGAGGRLRADPARFHRRLGALGRRPDLPSPDAGPRRKRR